MKNLLLIIMLAALATMLGGDGAKASSFRVKCCHGRGSYYCNHDNCGSSCKSGLSCHGCWKDCSSAKSIDK
jgi:hypothetical protein